MLNRRDEDFPELISGPSAVHRALTNIPRRPSMPVDGTDPIKILLAIILPPVGVFLEVGIGLHFWLNILLTLLGYIPGIIHAVFIILRK
jgi:uncharacterized membrane protein YqaE (UPF0057 family)